MGEVVGAGLLAHVPTIVLPEADRREMNNGQDTTLVAGLRRLRREVFETLDYDTVVVLDSHWATTFEFVVTAHDRRTGLYTSEELPRGMSQRPYDMPGDPELAHAIAARADAHGTWITPIDDPHLPVFYATTNLWEYLGQGLPDKRWISIGVCQTGDGEDHLRLGRSLGEGVAASGRKVILIASGALSHTFWPLRELRARACTASTRTRSAPARCTCGSTGPPPGIRDPGRPSWRTANSRRERHSDGVPADPARRRGRRGRARRRHPAGR
jgi:aromatic ring-opening dioxygenase catalytic subunit (LigB family)